MMMLPTFKPHTTGPHGALMCDVYNQWAVKVRSTFEHANNTHKPFFLTPLQMFDTTIYTTQQKNPTARQSTLKKSYEQMSNEIKVRNAII
jgi:hypothetical protein